MPLLWNMVKSFIIRYRLEASLPKNIRKHYSLIMDPAAGTVSVGVDAPHLHLGSYFWRSDIGRLATNRTFPHREKDLLSETWMGLESIGIHPHYTGDRKRFTIDIDLRAESVNLACSWPAFIVLSLALGVDPYRGGLLDLKRNKSTDFREIILKSSDDDQSIISVRKLDNLILGRVSPPARFCCLLAGLAWVGSMIDVRENELHVIPSGRENYYDIDRERHQGTPQVHLHSLMDVPRQATEGALVWVLYSETYRHRYRAWGSTRFIRGVLPVTQKTLKIREDIVIELRHLNDLEASLHEIFGIESPLVDTILPALRREWDTLDRISEGKRGARPYTENPPGYVDIWENLQGNNKFKELYDNFYPFPSSRATDLAQFDKPVIVLAKVIIAVSSIQKWPREEWSVKFDGNRKPSFTIPDDPMDELLPKGEFREPRPAFSFTVGGQGITLNPFDAREAADGREDYIYLS